VFEFSVMFDSSCAALSAVVRCCVFCSARYVRQAKSMRALRMHYSEIDRHNANAAHDSGLLASHARCA
jgi:hypothetical protein